MAQSAPARTKINTKVTQPAPGIRHPQVAGAFTAAMRQYGVPAEVLTDNGKQFTGRFTKPRPAEVLFERVCREHGITGETMNSLLHSH
jgi:hypothetical protein